MKKLKRDPTRNALFAVFCAKGSIAVQGVQAAHPEFKKTFRSSSHKRKRSPRIMSTIPPPVVKVPGGAEVHLDGGLTKSVSVRIYKRIGSLSIVLLGHRIVM
jgi:hypothetical protein